MVLSVGLLIAMEIDDVDVDAGEYSASSRGQSSL
jgi:hypothetical protein